MATAWAVTDCIQHEQQGKDELHSRGGKSSERSSRYHGLFMTTQVLFPAPRVLTFLANQTRVFYASFIPVILMVTHIFIQNHFCISTAVPYPVASESTLRKRCATFVPSAKKGSLWYLYTHRPVETGFRDRSIFSKHIAFSVFSYVLIMCTPFTVLCLFRTSGRSDPTADRT